MTIKRGRTKISFAIFAVACALGLTHAVGVYGDGATTQPVSSPAATQPDAATQPSDMPCCK